MRSGATIKSIETLQRSATEYMAKRLDAPLDVRGIFAHQAVKFSKDGYSAPFGTFVEYEQEATELYSSEHSLVPGLLQTEGYARGAHHPSEDVA